MAIIVLYVVAFFAFLIWLMQLVDVLLRGEEHFENHTHRLIWFLVIAVGSIVGAIWYSQWKRRAVDARDATRLQEKVEEVVQAWQRDHGRGTAEP